MAYISHWGDMSCFPFDISAVQVFSSHWHAGPGFKLHAGQLNGSEWALHFFPIIISQQGCKVGTPCGWNDSEAIHWVSCRGSVSLQLSFAQLQVTAYPHTQIHTGPSQGWRPTHLSVKSMNLFPGLLRSRSDYKGLDKELEGGQTQWNQMPENLERLISGIKYLPRQSIQPWVQRDRNDNHARNLD